MIKNLKKQVESMERGMQDKSDLVAHNLNGIADLEAKLAFITDEKDELEKTLTMERTQFDLKAARLNETIEEMKDQVQEASMVQTKITIYEKKLEDMQHMQQKINKQEMELQRFREQE